MHAARLQGFGESPPGPGWPDPPGIDDACGGWTRPVEPRCRGTMRTRCHARRDELRAATAGDLVACPDSPCCCETMRTGYLRQSVAPTRLGAPASPPECDRGSSSEPRLRDVASAAA